MFYLYDSKKQSKSYFINKQKSVFINICRFGIASRQQESGVDLVGHWPIDERSFSISLQGSPKNRGGENNERKRPYRSGIIARYWFNIQRKSLISPFLPPTWKSISYFRFRAFVSSEKITKISHVCSFSPQRTSYQK